jgi:hypothetical protein
MRDAFRETFQPRVMIRFESLQEICDYFAEIWRHALQEAVRLSGLQGPPGKTGS